MEQYVLEEWIVRNVERYRNCSITKKHIQKAGGEAHFLQLLKKKGYVCKLEVIQADKGVKLPYLQKTRYIVEVLKGY